MMPERHFRKATAEELNAILTLFEQTINAVNAAHYSPEQLRAWTSSVSKKDRWQKKIDEKHFLLAFVGRELTGFSSLTVDGHLDFLFVSKHHQRQGIATLLYIALEQHARKHQVQMLTVDASITAKPFFEKHGFVLVQEQLVLIDGVALINFKMKKKLA